MKVMVIGVDGGTFDLIEPWANDGELPTFKKLMDEGVYSNLITTYPPLTGPAWVSMGTGCNPGKHGVFDYVSGDIDRLRVNDSSSVKVPYLWELLSEDKKSVSVINVPMTYPPSKVNGYMATSIMSRGEDITYPESFKKELEEGMGRNYKIGLNVVPQKGGEEKHLEDVYDWHDSVVKAVFYMLKSKKTDFFMTVFPTTDVVSHAYYKYMEEKESVYKEEVLKAYKTVDKVLGEILDVVGEETNFIIVSDHGFGELKGMVNINNFLADKGYIKFKKLSVAKNLLFRMGITPKNVFRIMKKLKIAGLARTVSVEKRNKVLDTFIGYKDLDMEQTLAYSRGHVGQIHLNRKAIKNMGLEFEDISKKLIDDLKEIKDPETGNSLLTYILTRKEMYNGPYVDMGADLFVVFDNFGYIAYPLFAADNRVITQHLVHRSGTHRMNGIFLGYGPNFKSGLKLDDRSIYDITPTILYLMDSKIPVNLDGKVIEEGIKGMDKNPEYIGNRERKEKSNGDEEAKVIQRLKDLGYLG